MAAPTSEPTHCEGGAQAWQEPRSFDAHSPAVRKEVEGADFILMCGRLESDFKSVGELLPTCTY